MLFRSETENLPTGRWDAAGVRTFIECVQDNVDWGLIGDCKHIFETLRQCGFSGLFSSVIMLRVKAVKDVTTRARLGGKLDKKRREEVSTILFIEVPEVKVKVSNRP